MNPYEIEHAALMRYLGAECAVLMKADGSFPLEKPGKLALFGSGARHTIKGGTGSGEVNSRYTISVEQGLEEAGFTLTSKTWLDAYDETRNNAKRAFLKHIKSEARAARQLAVVYGMGAVMPEPEYDLPLEGEGDVAVYVLSRISGEGSDRKPVAGDIFLTETEKRDILLLQKTYPRFMLVLNVGGVVDLSPVQDVSNILLLSQLGAETGAVLADLLLGKTYPSGKLSTTWSSWSDYPTIGEFGNRDDTRYGEGIYVGYRYFDSVGTRALFPFGFGLSYTNFEVDVQNVKIENTTIRATARVRNTGMQAGREVVQLYVSSPRSKLDQPYQALAAFQKSRALHPGDVQTVSLEFDIRDRASYDTDKAAWILERGDYIVRLGTSSVDTVPIAVIQLDEDAITQNVENTGDTIGFKDWRPSTAFSEAPPNGVPVLTLHAEGIAPSDIACKAEVEIDPVVKNLSDEELAYLNVGAAASRGGILSVIGNSSRTVAGAAGETMAIQGVPSIVMADGPAGLRLSPEYKVGRKGVRSVGSTMPQTMIDLMPAPVSFAMNLGRKIPRKDGLEQYCTAIPIGTAIAQSWNLDLAERCGDIVGREMERFGVQLWLAPALNIHRDIRCGRNFEYFSEDPLVSGLFAAALTRGVQKHKGCGTTLKHYAANNQETNRYNSNSIVSERALREIYLRGFGIAIRESRPAALMTSYNLLNGTHTSERHDLIEGILRREFGFEGVVMTDWIVMGGTMDKKSIHPAPRADLIAAAGNDVTMPGSKPNWKNILKGLKAATVTRNDLERNATRILRAARQLNNQ